MKVCIINKWDVEGGAARAAYRLFIGLQCANVDVEYYVNEKKSDIEGVYQVGYETDVYRLRIEELVQHIYVNSNRTKASNTFFSFTYAGVNLFNDGLVSSNIINLHWVDKMVSSELLAQLASIGKPIVWTLHDMKPFTGGCHYSGDCIEYIESCLNCPQLKYDPFGLPNKVNRQKIELFKKIPLTIVCPSRWLANAAKQSSIFRNHRIEVIPNSVETDLFKPMSKSVAKERLGVKMGQCVLQFGAHDAREKRKGFDYLISALNKALGHPKFRELCEHGKIVVLCLGRPSKELKKLPIDMLDLGYLSQDSDIVLSYNATDIFVLPTLEDNLPNTMLESLACATPVIAFDSGGVTEVVKHRENGLIAARENVDMLAKHIVELVLDEEMREKYGNNGRRLIETRFKLSDQALGYKNLFVDLLENGEKGYIKEKSQKQDLYFDDIVGYSFRNEIRLNSNIQSQGVSEVESPAWVEALDNMCRNSFWKHPMIKINAYRDLVTLYNKRSSGY